MLKHTKRQFRYYKSQLYNSFVISDVCKRSLCVIPFKTEMAKNQKHLLQNNRNGRRNQLFSLVKSMTVGLSLGRLTETFEPGSIRLRFPPGCLLIYVIILVVFF